jgi:20S proteasome alpha/beta subunit
MTTAIGMVCSDGLVIGTDTKVTDGRRKYQDDKLLMRFRLGEREMAFAIAGKLRHAMSAIEWLELDRLSEVLGESPSFDGFLAKVIEVRLPQFVADYRRKYDANPDIEMLIGYVDEDSTPRLIQVFPDGDYDLRNNFVAIGSGATFGEILLRKLYYPQISVAVAPRIVGYIVWEIQGVDNESGEHMQIVSIGKDGKALQIDDLEIETYKHLPLLLTKSYEAIRKRIETIDLSELKRQLGVLQSILKQTSTEK